MKVKQRAISALILAIILIIFFCIPDLIRGDIRSELKIYFLDVGQGDSVLVEVPNGIQVLIDAGRGGKVIEELDKILPIWDRYIDVLILTHGDLDHIGGFFDVIDSYQIEKIIRANTLPDSKYLTEFLEQAKNLNIEIQEISMGDKIILDQTNQIYLETYWPPNENLQDSNENSLVIEMVHNENEFLFTGDATIETELKLIQEFPEKINSDVLKVGHHGSKTSTSQLFLEKVTPDFSILSYGENSYGHPNPEVLERLEKTGGRVLHTKKQGTVSLVSDGEEINFSSDRHSGEWKISFIINLLETWILGSTCLPVGRARG